MSVKSRNPEVVVVMGSSSDLPIMKMSLNVLRDFDIASMVEIVSAHRTPELLKKSVQTWQRIGVRVIIAGAGGAAHLPGMLASFSVLPVIGVPVRLKELNGLDSVLSIVQMPTGVPVAAVAVNNAANAGILAAQILGVGSGKRDQVVQSKVGQYKKALFKKVAKDRAELRSLGVSKFIRKQLIKSLAKN